ncbi:Beige/BEACH domain containing protein [Acanthamoeba castellanii str. Neff]|uniref:Beige/BEACH domain containing protein n=1 Tax=Acanthamoeba castellanii (strain ATCC 30010 / Neff) TaxID=1257118 RepID=L8GMA0_ACACF|nr:Beige/BEACH domain containing protein [Acanthamoeba castellanii str. Neff]ELR13959.1 Beige/BEACH domain containing protein [Acanthamoeba castellanii str. Neff]
MLKLTFHFLVGNAGNQDAFRRDNGLRRLYAMLNDVALRGPILRVVAIIAIGSSSSTPSAGATIKSETGGGTGSEDVGGAIIRDIISVLQSSGGTSALSKEDAFRTNGGFIWAISVMNGIGKSIDTEAEEAKEKDAKQAHQAAADSTQPSEGVDDGAVDPESNGDAATAPRSPAPAPASGSGPEASQEAFTFIKMLLNTLSIALTANVDNRRYFRSEIRFAALAEALQACHFVIHVGQRAIEICDALIDVAVRHSWPPSCPTHYKKYVTIYNKEREKEEKRKRDDEARERRRRQHHAQDHASDFHHYDGNDDHDGEADTFMSARRRSRSFSAISSSSSFSAWASSTRDKIIEETVKSCGVCRGQLEMENPEIFKIIIQLLASAQGRTDDRDICYILNKLTFLATLSPSNQHQIAGVEVVCDLLDHFRGILTAGDLSTLTSTADAAARAAHMAGGGTTTSAAASISSSNTRAFLHSTVLRFVSKIASHSISLQALRKYLKLMKDPADFPVSLLSTLVAIAKRDGHVVPSYFLDFSNSKAGVALPSTEAKVIWPPPEGYTIAFWLNLTSDGSGAHPTSHGSGKRLRIVPGKAVSESHVTNIDLREHKSDEAATHIFTLNSANKQCQTEVLIRAGVLTLRLGNKLNATFDDFKFREKRWYHVAITHSPQKVASVVKLSVDGLLRGSVPFTYPRPTSAHLFAFLGAPPLSYSLATGAAGASAAAAPASVPHRTESASQATLAASLAHDEEAKREASFQLGNLYLFEEAAEEPDVLFLYMLGPNYCGNLDVDLGMFQTYDIINADSVKLLAKGNPISPVNNPYMAGRLAAQRKGAPLSMGLEVSFSGEVPTRSAAAAADESSQWSAGRDYDDGSSDDVSTGGGDQQWADGRAAADSHALLLLDPSLYNDQMSHLDDTIVFLFSARNMVMAQAFRIDSFGTSRAPHQHHLNTSSLLDKEGAAQSTVAPTLQSPGGLGSATVAASPQPPSSSAAGAGAASSASSASTAGAGAGAGVGASPQKRSGKKTKNHILLANIAHHHDGVALRKRLSIQEMIFNIGGVTNLLWFLSTLPSRHDVLARFVAAAKKRESAADTSASSAASSSESEGEAAAAAQPAAGRSRVNREELPNEEELLSALPEAERLAYKIQIKECVERQRQAIRLLHSLLLNNARNVKELLDVSGYQLLARIIRKHRWTLDETLLSLMFNFVGLRKSRPQSLPYSSASAQAHSSSRMRAPLSSRSVPQFDDDSKVGSSLFKQAPTFIAKVKDLMRNESSTSRKGSLPTPDHLASFAAGGQQPTFAFTSPSGSGSAPATPQREHAFASAAFGPSIVFSDGVVANLPAFVHLILNRKLWGSASVSVQEIVFESLARLVANHEQASFNIMRFREAGLIDIFMRMFKEEADTLCIGFAPTLMVILRSIMTDPPYLTDLQKVVSYLIASHHKFGMARNLSSASPEGVRSISAEGLAKYQTTPARWRTLGRNLPSAKGLTLPGLSTASSLMSTNTSTGMVGPGDEALRSIRVHVLQMLLDIVTSGGQQSIRVVESAMSLELLLEFIQHEDEETRIIILKLLDVFLRNSTNRTQFFQMKGWHLLGDILKPFKVGEELLAVLFAMLLGKPTHSYNAPNIGAGFEIVMATGATSVTLNFLGKLSDEDIVLQHPGAMTTILVLVGSHFIMPNTRHAAIKTLHDIFLQNDPVKDQFISNHLIELLCDLFVVGYQEKFPTTPDNRAAQSQPSPGVSPYSSQQASSDLTPDEQQQTSAAAAAAAAAELSCESCPPQPDRAHQAETAGAEQQDLSGDPAAAAAAEEEEEEEEGEVEEDEDKEWELEEDVLRFLKTVALHRCVTGTPSTMPPKLLDDIFLTMEVLEGLPREYVVRLRERVLVDVFWFFRDNNIANSSTLLNALQKLCVLALHAWLWRDSIVLLECRKVPASSKPWAYKARDMFKDNVLCMIFALFNILREKIDLTSTQAGLLLAPISLPQMQYRRALLRLLQSNVEPWILSALSKLLPAPTLSPGSSSSYLRSPLSSSLSELRSTNSMLLANIGDKEFVVSFLYHSWPLLAHPNPAISMQTQECWRIVIHSTLDYLSLATLEDLLLQAEQHVREANQRKRDREQQRGDGGDGDDKKKMEEEEKRKKSGEGEGGKEEEEWTRKVKAEQVEEILLEEHISHFVRRTEDTEANAKDKWQKERQKARKKKAIKIFRHKSKVKANGKSVKNHYFALQHEQEKANIQYLSDKEHEEQLLLHQWKDLVKKVTHQEAVWPLPNVIARPLLDATEGTTRMRIRLKPTLTRPLDKLFKEDGEPLEWLSPKMILRLQKLKKIRIGGLYKEQMQKNENHVALKPGEKVLLASKCQCITPFSTREGEMVVGAKYTYFFDMSEPYSSLVSTKAPVSSLEATAAIAEGEDPTWAADKRPRKRGQWVGDKSITLQYEDIKEIHKRRYLLKNTAMEIFLTTGRTYLLAFPTKQDRNAIYEKLLSLDLPNRVDYETEVGGNILKRSITEKWRRGEISNFEYLMHLNTLAGRSFNDLTQYPIFPFLLRDYTSEELDLTNPNTFRDLSKPMGAQDPTRLKKFIDKYEMLLEMNDVPYYYGSHYSNIGSVLHFLVRVQPFTRGFIEFQGGRFDVPDRVFHALDTTWSLSSSMSNSDVKELIPEFFYFPEFLENQNHFDLGIRHDSVRVDNVLLPPWAKGDPRIFIRKHREALECRYVSERLHQWIDLMYGALQRGDAARKAYNVFHPLTYEGAVEVDSIQDEVMRKATIAQISSYGQTPRLLFRRAHPEKVWREPEPTVYSHPHQLWSYPLLVCTFEIHRIDLVDGQPIPQRAKRVLLHPEGTAMVSWGYWDQNIRLCSVETGKVLLVIKTSHDDEILCADITQDGQYLATGGTSSLLKVWKLKRVKQASSRGRMRIRLQAILSGHAHDVLSVVISKEWSLIISGGREGKVILWDLNRLCYIRTLKHHRGPVTSLAISPTTGDIVTVDNGSEFIPVGEKRSPRNVSTICLWTINGRLVASTTCQERINCVALTHGTEGLSRNVVICGLDSGTIKIWDAFDLSFLSEMKNEKETSPITALCLNADFSQLFVGHANGALVSWSPRRMSNPAQLIKNLTLGRRKVTPLSSTSSTSVAIRKASRDLFEREAAAELARLNNVAEGGSSGDEAEQQQQQQQQHRQRSNSNNSMASSDSEGDSGAEIEEQS